MQWAIMLLLCLGQFVVAQAQQQSFKVDPEASTISFEITHLGYLTVEGTFHRFRGSFEMAGDSISSVLGIIEVASIDTEDKSRDESLRSDAYLDAEAYPHILFKSTQGDLDAGTLTGDLSIKGVTRSVDLSVKSFPTQDGSIATLHFSTIINRQDFKLDFGMMDSLVGDEIKIKLEVVGRRP
jgi:polyisoprenoid-binding protein YceI